MINIKSLDPNKINIQKYLQKYCYVTLASTKSLYLIISNAKRCIEESNEKKCLALLHSDESRDMLKKYKEI